MAYANISAQNHLWMKSKNFDLLFFHLSGFAVLIFLIPYMIWGSQSIFPVYNFYLVFFGLPHNYLTWATLFPTDSKSTFNMKPIWFALGFCLLLCLAIPLVEKTNLHNVLLSIISYWSLWHAYRQHHGICKVYDSIQAKRTQDTTVFNDRKALNWFFGLAANGVVVWAFTHDRIDYLLSAEESYQLIYPQVSYLVYQIYVAVTCAIGIYALKRAIYDRYRAGKFIPWPQISLMFIAITTYVVPYIFLPISAMPLAVAIGTMYHNVQYFAFVWLFEKSRAQDLNAEMKFSLGLPQKLALNASWVKYFGLSLMYSFVVIGIYLVTPRSVGLTFVYFLAFAHYVVDGYIWTRKCNTRLGAFVGSLSATDYSVMAKPRTVPPSTSTAEVQL